MMPSFFNSRASTAGVTTFMCQAWIGGREEDVGIQEDSHLRRLPARASDARMSLANGASPASALAMRATFALL